MKKPRTLAQLKAHSAVDMIVAEHNGYAEYPNDYWVYLIPGWQNREAGTHQIHEEGVKATLAAFNSCVAKCDCEQCKKNFQ